MEVLFITPQEMTTTTILGGNVDTDKYLFCIASVQLSVIEPLLGATLYEKIRTDFAANTLAGAYLELFTDYVKPIVKHEAVAEFIEISSYALENGGLYKRTAENREIVTKDETQSLSNKYHAMAQMYIGRFTKWISTQNLPEFSRCETTDVKLTAGWKL